MSIYGGYETQAFIAEYYDFVPGYHDRPIWISIWSIPVWQAGRFWNWAEAQEES